MFLVVQVNSLALTANCRFAEAEVKAPICPGIRKISILSLGWYVFRHMHDVVGNNDKSTLFSNSFNKWFSRAQRGNKSSLLSSR